MTDYSYQLYSSRNFGPLPDTLKMVADLGYTQVEGYGALLGDPERGVDPLPPTKFDALRRLGQVVPEDGDETGA